MGDFISHIFWKMNFKIIENLKFVNVNMNFLKILHEASSEVYYQAKDYEHKPYLGILLSSRNYKYVIPLTSVKEKHTKWKIEDKDRLLIYDIVDKTQMVDNDFYIEKDDCETYYHIWAAMDIKKMIPVVDNVITYVDMTHKDSETEDIKKYKDLLNKEFAFLIKIKDKIIQKANKVYEKQVNTKNGLKFCCDFKALEKVVDDYKK